MGFWHINKPPNLGQKTRAYGNQQKKKQLAKLRTLLCVADQRIKLKENEKDKYLDLIRKLKQLCNMKVTMIPIVIGTFGTVTKRLLKGLEDLEIRGRVNAIQPATLLRMARILRRVLETRRDLLSLKLKWKTITKCRYTKLSRSKQ